MSAKYGYKIRMTGPTTLKSAADLLLTSSSCNPPHGSTCPAAIRSVRQRESFQSEVRKMAGLFQAVGKRFAVLNVDDGVLNRFGNDSIVRSVPHHLQRRQ